MGHSDGFVKVLCVIRHLTGQSADFELADVQNTFSANITLKGMGRWFRELFRLRRSTS